MTEDEPKGKGGRPSDFRPEFCDQVTKLCRLGATDEDIANFFDKTVATIYNWKNKHPEFLEAIKEGKVLADMYVSEALYKAATGYVMETEKIIGKGDNARVVTVRQAVAPDITAGIFWLTNRQKAHWRQRQTQEVVGKNDGPIQSQDVPAPRADGDHFAEIAKRYARPFSVVQGGASKNGNGHAVTNGHGNGHTNGTGAKKANGVH